MMPICFSWCEQSLSTCREWLLPTLYLSCYSPAEVLFIYLFYLNIYIKSLVYFLLILFIPWENVVCHSVTIYAFALYVISPRTLHSCYESLFNPLHLSLSSYQPYSGTFVLQSEPSDLFSLDSVHFLALFLYISSMSVWVRSVFSSPSDLFA